MKTTNLLISKVAIRYVYK